MPKPNPLIGQLLVSEGLVSASRTLEASLLIYGFPAVD
jgi:hypothetical protein